MVSAATNQLLQLPQAVAALKVVQGPSGCMEQAASQTTAHPGVSVVAGKEYADGGGCGQESQGWR
eukprot:8500828-Prorocentrum_lima.AAC.1